MKKVFFFFLILLASYSYAQRAGIRRIADRDKYQDDADSVVSITPKQLDSISAACVILLREKNIYQYTDDEHRTIIRLVNSGFMSPWADTALFQTEVYSAFLGLFKKTCYKDHLSVIYPDWVYSRGMGYYFPKLRVELWGSPYLRSYFSVEN